MKRLGIGVVVGLVGLFLLDDSTTRLAAFAGWMAVWTLAVVVREGRVDRWRRQDEQDAADEAAAEAAAAQRRDDGPYSVR